MMKGAPILGIGYRRPVGVVSKLDPADDKESSTIEGAKLNLGAS